MEPTEWPKGSQAPCGVWREDSGLLSRPCRKRRSSSRHDRGVLLVFSSCGASVRFLTRCDGKLREPFVWRQGSQVSMRMARRERVIALQIWYGNRASRYVKAGLSRSFSGCGRKPWVPSTSAGDFRELLRGPLRSQAYCGFGTGLSGLLWFCGNGKGLVLSGGRNLRLPLHF